MTVLFRALIHLARLRWLGAAFCALAMLCVTTHASALADATAHARVHANVNADITATASASEVAQTKDRVWGFDQNSPLHVCALRDASVETHPGISPTLPETASGPSYAAEGGAEALKLLPPPSVVPNAGGRIVSFVTERDRVFYRVFSGDATRGGFLTSVKPKSSAFAREALALPASNEASLVQEVLVPAGTRLQRSRALPAFGRRGGAEQFQLLDQIPNGNFGAGVPLQ